MVNWAITFFLIAIAAALLGFSGSAAGQAGIAKVIFFLFLALSVATLVLKILRRDRQAR